MRKALLITIALLTTAVPFAVAPTQAYADCRAGCECITDPVCMRKKIIDPRDPCEVNYCAGENPNTSSNQPDPVTELNIFGTRIKLNSEVAIQQLIFLAFSLFLGIVALTVAINGLMAGVKRTQTTDAGEIKKLTQTMQNSIVGLVIVVMSLLIAQFVASFLGLGSLTNLVTYGQLIPEAEDFQQ